MRIVTEADAQRPARYAAHEALSYTLRDAAALTGLSDDTLRRRAKEGRLRLVKVAGRTLVDGESLRALIRGEAPAPGKAAA